MPNPKRKGSTRAWRKLRAQILKRDGYICWICGHPGADTVDHLVPWKDTQEDHWANLAAAHGSKRPEYGCQGNYSRGAKSKAKPKPKRTQKAHSGETTPLRPCSWSDYPSPNLGKPYLKSVKVTRMERPSNVSEG